eukprot:SAG22_NODE_4299_length_1312_cov_3.888706_1_plen_267_part_10
MGGKQGLVVLAAQVLAASAQVLTPSVDLVKWDGDGRATYQLKVAFDPDDVYGIHTIYGSPETPLALPPAYQDELGSDVGGVSPEVVELQPTAAFDSWLAIGSIDGSTADTFATAGIDFSAWNDGAYITAESGFVSAFDSETVVPNNVGLTPFRDPSLAAWIPAAATDPADIVGIENANLTYTAAARTIELDADLSDWGTVPILAQTPFRRGGTVGADANGATGGGPWCEFDEYGGGIHNGIEDQAMAFALVWDTEAVYLGVKVFDDT